MDKGIRWLQRFLNYVKAYKKLSEAIEYVNHNTLENKENIKEGSFNVSFMS